MNKLDKEEKELLNSFEKGEWKSRLNLPGRKACHRNIPDISGVSHQCGPPLRGIQSDCIT